jgi:hypothetical protein
VQTQLSQTLGRLLSGVVNFSYWLDGKIAAPSKFLPLIFPQGFVPGVGAGRKTDNKIKSSKIQKFF